MEEDERKRKILAGKDKLAAFRKKKGRKRRKRPEGGEDGFSDTSSLADGSEYDFTSDSDAGSMSGDMSAEEEEFAASSVSLVRARADLKKASQKVATLEETLLGKQSLVESLAEENQKLVSQLQEAKPKSQAADDVPTQTPELSTPDSEQISQLSTVEEFKSKVFEFRDALAQRDVVIKQLSDNLQATRENRDSLQQEYMAQAEQLAQQVQILQLQLKQAGEWLRKEMGVHGISGQALLEAKNELLALQESNKQKETHVLVLQASVKERDVALTQLVEKYKQNSQEFQKVQAENATLREGMEKLVPLQTEYQTLKEGLQGVETLREENRVLREKESQTNEVVKQLMLGAEKSGASRVQLSTEGMLTVDAHQEKIAALKAELEGTYGEKIAALRVELDETHSKQIAVLRAELDESHGIQITEMKQHLRQQHQQEREKIDASHLEQQSKLSQEITDLKGQLSGYSDGAQDVDSELQTLRAEKTAYIEHIHKLNAHIQAMGQEREVFAKEFQSSRQRIEELQDFVVKSQKETAELAEVLQRTASERASLLSQVEHLQNELSSVQIRDSRSQVVTTTLQVQHMHTHEASSMVTPALDEGGEGSKLLVSELREKLQNAEAEIQQLQSQDSAEQDPSTSIEVVQRQYQQELENLKTQHSEVVQSMRDEFVRTLQMSTEHNTEAFSTMQERLQSDYESSSASQKDQQSQLLGRLHADQENTQLTVEQLSRQSAEATAELEKSIASRERLEDNYTAEITTLKAEILELRSSQMDRTQDVSQRSTQVELLDSDYDRVTEEVEKLKEERAEALRKLEESMSEKDLLQSELDSKIDHLEARYSDANLQLESLSQEKTEVLHRLEVTLSEKSLLQTSYEEELRQVKEQYQDVSFQMESLRGEHTETLTKLETVMASSESLKDGHSAERDQLQSEHAQVLAALDSLKAEKQELDHRFETLLAEKELEGAVAEREQLAHKYNGLLADKEQWESLRLQNEETLNALSVETQNLQSEKQTLEAEKGELLKQHNETLQSLQSENQERESDLGAQVQQLNSELESEVAELKAKRSAMAEELQHLHQQKEEKDQNIWELQAELENTKKQYVSELALLKEERDSLVDHTRGQYETDIIRSQEQYDLEVQKMKRTHDSEILALKEAHETQLLEATSTLEQVIVNLKDDHTRELDNVNEGYRNAHAHLKQDHNAEVQKLKADLSEMQTEFESVLDISRAEFSEKMDKVRAEFSEKEEDIRELAAEKQALQDNLEQSLSDLEQKAEYAAELEEMKTELENQLHQGIHDCDQHREIIESLASEKVEQESRLSALKSQNDDLEQQILKTQKERDQARQSVDQSNATCESLQAEKEVLHQSLHQVTTDRDSQLQIHTSTVDKLKQNHDVALSAITEELNAIKQVTEQAEADRVTEITKLQDDLRESRERYQLFREEKQSEVENLQQELETAHTRLDTIAEETSILKQDNVELVNDLKKEHAETLNQLCDEVRDLKEERDQILADKVASLELLTQQLKELEADIEDINAQKEMLRQDLKATERKHEEEKIALLSETGNHFEEQCAELRQKILCLEVEKEKLEETVETGLTDKEDLSERVHELEANIARLESEKSGMEAEQERVSTEMRTQVDELMRERKALQEEQEKLNTAISQQEATLQETWSQLTAASTEKQALTEQLHNQDRTMEESMVAVDNLKLVNAQLQEESGTLKQENQKLADWINKDHESIVEKMQADISRLQEERDIAKNECTQMVEDMRSEHAATVQQLKDELLGTTFQKDTMAAEYEGRLQQQTQNHEDTIRNLEQKIQEIQAEASASTDQSKQRVHELEQQLNQTVSDRDTVAAKYQSEVSDLKEQLEDEIQEIQTTAAGSEDEFRRTVHELEEQLNLSISDRDTLVARHQAQVTDLKERLQASSQQQSEVLMLRQQLESTQHGDSARGNSLRQELDELREERNLLKMAADHYEKELHSMQQQLNKLNKDRKRVTGSFEEEMLRMKNKVDAAVEERNAMKISYETDMSYLTRQVEEKENANQMLKKQIIRLTEMGATSQASEDDLEDVGDGEAADSTQEDQAIVEKYNQKAAKLKEQHEMEMKVIEFNLTEMHKLEMNQVRSQVEAELDRTFKQQKAELELAYQQKAESLRAEKEHEFVEQLQQMKRGFDAKHTEAVDEVRRRYNEGNLHQMTVPEADQLQTMKEQMDKLQKENEELAEARDALLTQIDGLLAGQENLEQEFEEVSEENAKLTMQLSPSQRDAMTWHVQHDTLLKDNQRLQEMLRSRKPSSAMTDSLEEEDFHSGDLQLEVQELRKENELLKTRIEDANLAAQETWQEEWLAMQSKYSSVVRENESMMFQLRSAGIISSREHSADRDSIGKDSLEPDDFGAHAHKMRKDSLDDDFIDWKLKYELSQGENQTLRSKMEASRMIQSPTHRSPRLSPVARSPTRHQSFNSMQQRYGDIAAENEILRAKLGRLGLPTEGAPEDDFVNIPGQFDLIVEENETLKAKLDAYESGRLDPLPHQDVTWRAKYETILKEYEVLKTQVDHQDSSMMMLDHSVQFNIDELESQYNDLMKENEALKQEMQTKDQSATSMLAELEQKCAALHKQCDELNAELHTAKPSDKSSDLEGTVAALREENGHLRQQLSTIAIDHQERYTAVQNQCEELQAQLAISEPVLVPSQSAQQEVVPPAGLNVREGPAVTKEPDEKFVELQKECDDLKAHLGKSKDKSKRDYTKLKAKLLSATKENAQLKAQVKELQEGGPSVDNTGGNDTVDSSTSVDTSSHASSHPDSRDSSVLSADNCAELTELKAQYANLVTEHDALKQQLVKAEESGGITIEELVHTRVAFVALQKQHDALQQSVNAQEQGAPVSSSDMDQELQRYATLQAEYDSVKGEFATLQEHLQDLLCRQQTLTEENNALKAQAIEACVDTVASQTLPEPDSQCVKETFGGLSDAVVESPTPATVEQTTSLQHGGEELLQQHLADLQARYQALVSENELLKQERPETNGADLADLEARYQTLLSENELLKQQGTEMSDLDARYHTLLSENELLKQQKQPDTSPQESLGVVSDSDPADVQQATHTGVQTEQNEQTLADVQAQYQSLLSENEMLKQQKLEASGTNLADIEAKYQTLLSEHELLKQKKQTDSSHRAEEVDPPGDVQQATHSGTETEQDEQTLADLQARYQSLLAEHELLKQQKESDAKLHEIDEYVRELESKVQSLETFQSSTTSQEQSTSEDSNVQSSVVEIQRVHQYKSETRVSTSSLEQEQIVESLESRNNALTEEIKSLIAGKLEVLNSPTSLSDSESYTFEPRHDFTDHVETVEMVSSERASIHVPPTSRARSDSRREYLQVLEAKYDTLLRKSETEAQSNFSAESPDSHDDNYTRELEVKYQTVLEELDMLKSTASQLHAAEPVEGSQVEGTQESQDLHYSATLTKPEVNLVELETKYRELFEEHEALKAQQLPPIEQDDYTQLQQRYDALIVECEALKAQSLPTSETDSDYNQLQQRYDALIVECEALKAQPVPTSETDSDYTQLQQRYDALSVECEALKAQSLPTSETDSDYNQLQQRYDALSVECEALKAQRVPASETDSDYTQLQQRYDALSVECQALKAQLVPTSETDSDYTQLQQRYDALSVECEALKAQPVSTSETDSDYNQMQQRYDALSVESEALKAQPVPASETDSDYNQLQQKYDTLTADFEALKLQLSNQPILTTELPVQNAVPSAENEDPKVQPQTCSEHPDYVNLQQCYNALSVECEALKEQHVPSNHQTDYVQLQQSYDALCVECEALKAQPVTSSENYEYIKIQQRCDTLSAECDALKVQLSSQPVPPNERQTVQNSVSSESRESSSQTRDYVKQLEANYQSLVKEAESLRSEQNVALNTQHDFENLVREHTKLKEQLEEEKMWFQLQLTDTHSEFKQVKSENKDLRQSLECSDEAVQQLAQLKKEWRTLEEENTALKALSEAEKLEKLTAKSTVLELKSKCESVEKEKQELGEQLQNSTVSARQLRCRVKDLELENSQLRTPGMVEPQSDLHASSLFSRDVAVSSSSEPHSEFADGEVTGADVHADVVQTISDQSAVDVHDIVPVIEPVSDEAAHSTDSIVLLPHDAILHADHIAQHVVPSSGEPGPQQVKCSELEYVGESGPVGETLGTNEYSREGSTSGLSQTASSIPVDVYNDLLKKMDVLHRENDELKMLSSSVSQDPVPHDQGLTGILADEYNHMMKKIDDLQAENDELKTQLEDTRALGHGQEPGTDGKEPVERELLYEDDLIEESPSQSKDQKASKTSSNMTKGKYGAQEGMETPKSKKGKQDSREKMPTSAKKGKGQQPIQKTPVASVRKASSTRDLSTKSRSPTPSTPSGKKSQVKKSDSVKDLSSKQSIGSSKTPQSRVSGAKRGADQNAGLIRKTDTTGGSGSGRSRSPSSVDLEELYRLNASLRQENQHLSEQLALQDAQAHMEKEELKAKLDGRRPSDTIAGELGEQAGSGTPRRPASTPTPDRGGTAGKKQSTTTRTPLKGSQGTPRRGVAEKSPREDGKQLKLLKAQVADLTLKLQSKDRENVEMMNMLRQSGRGSLSLGDDLQIQYEILLEEKKELCSQFEEEKAQFEEHLQELRERNALLEQQAIPADQKDPQMNGVAPVETKILLSHNSIDDASHVSSAEGTEQVQQLKDELMDIKNRYQTVQNENKDLEDQLQMLNKEKKQVHSQLDGERMDTSQQSEEVGDQLEDLMVDHANLRSQYQLLLIEKDELSSELEHFHRSVLKERSDAQDHEIANTSHVRVDCGSQTESDEPECPVSPTLGRPPFRDIQSSERESGILGRPPFLDLESPGRTLGGGHLQISSATAGMSFSELQIQYEILMQEKWDVCLKVEAEEAKVAELKQSQLELQSQHKLKQRGGAAMKAEHDSTVIQYEILMQEKKGVCAELDRQRVKVKECEEVTRTLTRQVAQLEKEREQINREKSDMQMEKEIFVQEKQSLCLKLDGQVESSKLERKERQKGKEKELSQEVLALQVENEKLNQDVELLKRDVRGYQEKVACLKEEVEDAKFRFEEMETSVEMLQGDNDTLRQQYDTVVQLCEDLKGRLERQKALGESELREALDDCLSGKKELWLKIKELESRHEQLIEENDELKKSLKEKAEQTSKEIEDLQDALQECLIGKEKLQFQVQSQTKYPVCSDDPQKRATKDTDEAKPDEEQKRGKNNSLEVPEQLQGGDSVADSIAPVEETVLKAIDMPAESFPTSQVLGELHCDHLGLNDGFEIDSVDADDLVDVPALATREPRVHVGGSNVESFEDELERTKQEHASEVEELCEMIKRLKKEVDKHSAQEPISPKATTGDLTQEAAETSPREGSRKLVVELDKAMVKIGELQREKEAADLEYEKHREETDMAYTLLEQKCVRLGEQLQSTMEEHVNALYHVQHGKELVCGKEGILVQPVLQQKCAELESKLSDCSSRCGSLEESLQNYQEMEKGYTEISGQYQELLIAYSDLGVQLKQMEERNNQEMSDLLARIEDAGMEKTIMEEDNRELENKCMDQEAELFRRKSQLKDLQLEQEATEGEKNRLKEDCEQIERNMQEVLEENRLQIEELESEVLRVTTECTEKDHENQVLLGKCEEVEKAVEDLVGEKNRLKEDCEQIERNMQEVLEENRLQIEELEAEILRVTTECTEKDQENHVLLGKCEEVEKAVEDLVGEKSRELEMWEAKMADLEREKEDKTRENASLQILNQELELKLLMKDEDRESLMVQLMEVAKEKEQKEDQNELLRDSSSDVEQRLVNMITEKDRQLSVTESELTELAQSKIILEQQLAQKSQELESKLEDLTQNKDKEVEEALTQIDLLKKDLEHSMSEKEELQTRCGGLEESVKQLSEELDALQQRQAVMGHMEEEKKSKELENETTQKKCRELEEVLNKEREELMRLSSEHNREVGEKYEAEKKAEDLLTQLHTITSEHNTVRVQHEKSEKEIQSLMEDVQKLERECKNLSEKCSQVEENFSEVSRAHHSLKTEHKCVLEEYEGRLEEKDENLSMLQKKADLTESEKAEEVQLMLKEHALVLEEKNTMIARLEGKISSLDDRVSALGDEKTEMEKLLRTAHSDYAFMKAKYESLEKALSDTSNVSEERELEIKKEVLRTEEKYQTTRKECDDLNNRLEDLEKKLVEQEQQVESSKALSTELSSELENVKDGQTALEKQLLAKEAQCEDYREEMKDMSAKLDDATGTLHETIKRLESKENEVTALKRESEILSSELDDCKLISQDRDTKCCQLKVSIGQLEASLNDKEAALSSIQPRAAESEKVVSSLTMKCQLMEEGLETTKEKLVSSETELKDRLLELGQSQERVATQGDKLAHLEEELKCHIKENATLRNTVVDLQKEESILKVKLEERDAQIGCLEREAAELKPVLAIEKDKVVDLEKQLANLSNDMASIQAMLGAEKESATEKQALVEEKDVDIHKMTESVKLLETEIDKLSAKYETALEELKSHHNGSEALRTNLNEVHGEFDAVKLKLREAEDVHTATVDEISNLKDSLAEKDKHLDSLTADLETNERSLQELCETKTAMKEECEQMEKEMSNLTTRNQELAVNVDEMEKQRTSLEAHLAEKNEETGHLSEEIALLKASKLEEDNNLSSLREALQVKISEQEVLLEKLACGDDATEQAMTKIGELERWLAEAESEKCEKGQEICKLEEKCHTLEDALKKHEEEIASLQKRLDDTAIQLESAEHQLKDEEMKRQEANIARSEIDAELEKTKSDCEVTVEAVKNDLCRAKQEQEKLQSELDDLNIAKAQAQEQIQALQTKCVQLENSIHEKEQQLQLLNEQHGDKCKALETEKAAMAQAAEDSKLELHQTMETINELTDKCGILSAEKEEGACELAATLSDVRALRDNVESAEQKVVELIDEKDVLQKHCARLEADLSDVQDAGMAQENLQLEVENLCKKSQELSNEIDTLRAENADLQKASGKLQKEKVEQKDALRCVSETLSGLQNKCSLLEEEKMKASGDVEVFQTELGVLAEEKVVLQGQLKKLEEYLKEWILNNSGPSEDSIFECIPSPEKQRSVQGEVPDDGTPIAASTPQEKDSDFSILESYFVLRSKNKCLEEDLMDMDTKYDSLKKEHENCPKVEDADAELNLPELQEENAQLFKKKTELEDELMSTRADYMDLEQQLRQQKEDAKKQKADLDQKLADFQSLLDNVAVAKEKLQEEMLVQRQEYESSLAAARMNALEEQVQDKTKREEIVGQVSEAERKVLEIKDRLRLEQEDKDLLRLKSVHLMRECKLYERHIQDLEKEVEQQQLQIQEATYEHKETIKMLAEMRMEQEASRREQMGEFTRLESEIHKLEWQMNSSTCSTPHAMSVASAPIGPTSAHNMSQSSVGASQLDRSLMSSSCEFFDLGPYRSSLGPEEDGHKALEMKHFQMVDELTKLNRELKSTKDKYTKETKLLKYALDKERKLRANLEEGRRQEGSSGSSVSIASSHMSRASSMSSIDQHSVFDFPSEMLCLRDKLAAVQVSNMKMSSERQALRAQLSKQEAILKELQAAKPDHNDESLRQQIELLQQQRDELAKQVDEYRRIEEQFATLKGEKLILEEQLKKEQDLHRQKAQQKEQLEVTLLRERLVLERQMREQHKLEDLVQRKEIIDYKIVKQEQQDAQLEATQDDTEPNNTDTPSSTERLRLESEKQKLELAISRRVKCKDQGVQVGLSGLPIDFRKRKLLGFGTKLPPEPTRLLKLDCGCTVEEGTSRMYVECRYHQAVENIRAELKKQPAMRKHRQQPKHRHHGGGRGKRDSLV